MSISVAYLGGGNGWCPSTFFAWMQTFLNKNNPFWTKIRKFLGRDTAPAQTPPGTLPPHTPPLTSPLALPLYKIVNTPKVRITLNKNTFRTLEGNSGGVDLWLGGGVASPSLAPSPLGISPDAHQPAYSVNVKAMTSVGQCSHLYRPVGTCDTWRIKASYRRLPGLCDLERSLSERAKKRCRQISPPSGY